MHVINNCVTIVVIWLHFPVMKLVILIYSLRLCEALQIHYDSEYNMLSCVVSL